MVYFAFGIVLVPASFWMFLLHLCAKTTLTKHLSSARTLINDSPATNTVALGHIALIEPRLG